MYAALGQPKEPSHTLLASTASAGSNQITVLDQTNWAVGDEIIIATTGDLHSMPESEKHKIKSVNSDGTVLELEVNGTL